MRNIVITSGGFDPLHNGHIEYLEKAALLGDVHICIVNKDQFLKRKKGYTFYTEEQRLQIIRALRCVTNAIIAIDEDDTVIKTLFYIRRQFPHDRLIFAKGGDRTMDEIPEAGTCRRLNIEIVDGLGAKIESSSEAVKRTRCRTMTDEDYEEMEQRERQKHDDKVKELETKE